MEGVTTMKKLIFAGLVALGTWGVMATTPAQAEPPNCAAVLCLTCPPGTVASPVPGNCCRCVPE
jgi:hypothetical protein